ncbi:MAG: diaminopropionate ammonia-lyase [Streptosporangiales bacterium]|nr:diaminopropionate ammonia-lyase [Streptosporangiales bacterium]
MVVNPYATEVQALDVATVELVSAFHRSLPGYAVTPLVEAPALAAELGVGEVWVKDESSRLGMPSFKILGASWATYRAFCARAGLDHTAGRGVDELRMALRALPPLTLVAATDGNHGRAVARMAGLLGLAAHILVPQDMVAARVEALEGEGARVTVVPGTYDEAVARSAELADDTHVVVSDTSWDGYREVPAWVIDGYATIAAEVEGQLAERRATPPTVVAAQIGVGAFAAAMVRGFVPGGARVVGAEPTKAACAQASIEAGELTQVGGALDSIMAGLNCGTPSPIAWPHLRAGVTAFGAVDDADAADAMRELAAAGVVSGESGAAGLAGVRVFADQLQLSSDDRVLVVSTEGATNPDAYQRIVGGAAQS